MSICGRLKSYSYLYVQVVGVLEFFGKLVKSRFKRLIFEVSEANVKNIKDESFLGCKVSDNVLEICDNWMTFVDTV